MNLNTQSITPLLNEYRSLELDAHISLDDVIMKVSEENHELQTALRDNDTPEIKSEARDVLINVLSVSARLIDLNYLNLAQDTDPQSINDDIALWIRQTAILRWRYSRGNTSITEYSETTSRLVSSLIHLIDEPSISSVISSSIAKLRNRIQEYLPDIRLEDSIDAYPDFPKPGILFRDIAPLLADPEALRYAGFELAKKSRNADVIVGLDARGFIFGTLVAQILEKPFVMIRKKGKLPWKTLWTDYSLEYGDNSIEIQENAIEAGKRVVIIDDLLATGGTFLAAAKLVEKVGGKVEKLVSLISLDEAWLLNHPSRLALSAYSCDSVLSYT